MTEISPEMDDLRPDLEPIKDTPIAPAHGIATIALNMAMKYHDINTVQDGVLYQQYKMEGKNLHGLHLDEVFHTAGRIEAWLLGASERIAKLVVDAITQLDDVESAEADKPSDEDAS